MFGLKPLKLYATVPSALRTSWNTDTVFQYCVAMKPITEKLSTGRAPSGRVQMLLAHPSAPETVPLKSALNKTVCPDLKAETDQLLSIFVGETFT